MSKIFLLASFLCVSAGATAQEAYPLALSDQELAADIGGISAAVTILVPVDNSQADILGGALPGNYFGIKTATTSSGTASVTQASAFIAMRATLSEGIQPASK